MCINEIVRTTLRNNIKNSGRTQVWLVSRVNAIDPQINMSKAKLSASLIGKRKISADEFIALCKALEISPDLIMERIADH